jgi:hypothetical protein
MNTNAIQTISSRLPDAAAPLQVVLTYDDPTMAKVARRLLDGFLAKWARDVDIHRDEWSFAEIEHAQCRQEALELARHCDTMVIAISGVEDLPVSFCDWLNDWIASRAPVETAILVCASNRTPFLRLERFSRLSSLAASNHLAFFITTLADSSFGGSTGTNPKKLNARLESIDPGLLPEVSALND